MIKLIPQEELKRLLRYDPETGIFTRLVSPARNVKVGDVAGGICHGYIRIKINSRGYAAHRLAWLYVYGECPAGEIDHINHDRSDNRIVNLRCVSLQDNQKNQRMAKKNTSGFNGVCWHKVTRKWMAQISVNDEKIYLGVFNSIDDAIMARKAADIKYDFHPNHGAKPCTG